MKVDAGSNEKIAIQTRESLIEQHPNLYNIFLILALISLVGLIIFLLSDVISFGQDASHKGLLEDIHSQKTIASEFILITNQTQDVLKKISLGVKPIIGLIYAGSSGLSEEKSEKSLSASNVSDNSGDPTAIINAINASKPSPNSSLLSSIPVSANSSRKISTGSGYVIIARSGGDSSHEDSSSESRLHHSSSGSASSKKSSEAASRINKSLQGRSKLDGSTPIQSLPNSSQVADALDDMQLNQYLRNRSQQNISETSDLSAGISNSEKFQPNANSSFIGGNISKTDQIGSKDMIDGVSTFNNSRDDLPSDSSASKSAASFGVASNNSSTGYVAEEGIHADETADSSTSTNNTTASSSNDLLPGLHALKSDAQNLSNSANQSISARDISMQMNASKISITPLIHYKGKGGNAADASKDAGAGDSADHFIVKSLKFKSNKLEKESSDTAKPSERKSKSISSASSSSKSKDGKKAQPNKRNRVVQGSKRPIRPDRSKTNTRNDR
jgi:trimeric autotransporter adhesin